MIVTKKKLNDRIQDLKTQISTINNEIKTAKTSELSDLHKQLNLYEKQELDILKNKETLDKTYNGTRTQLESQHSSNLRIIETETTSIANMNAEIDKINSLNEDELNYFLLKQLNENKKKLKDEYLQLITEGSLKFTNLHEYNSNKKKIITKYNDIIMEIKTINPIIENKPYYDIIKTRMTFIKSQKITPEEIKSIDSRWQQIKSKLRRDDTKHVLLSYINKIAGDIALLSYINIEPIIETRQFIELKNIFNQLSDEPFITEATKIIDDIKTEYKNYVVCAIYEKNIFSDTEIELLFENSFEAIRKSYNKSDDRHNVSASYKYIKYKTKYLELK